MNAALHNLRRADVVSRRLIRRAFIGWHTFTVKCAMAFTGLACSLPTSRTTQDAALYAFGAAFLVLLQQGVFQ